MNYLTRISFNSKNWSKPTGEARDLEQPGSYNQMFGFGHEDWLFRSEWEIDGWRYAFLQGANKSSKRLQKENKSFGVRLFCIQPDRRRRYIAEIDQVEVLSEKHAAEALRIYKQRGWLAQMKEEIKAVKGEVSALGQAEYATHILNIRYRESNLNPYPTHTYADPEDPVLHYSRYRFVRIDKARLKYAKGRSKRSGSELPPSLETHFRSNAPGRAEVSPAHRLMQDMLMTALRKEYPGGTVLREENYVDVILRTKTQRTIFEIKSTLSAETTIRSALGQLLEYLYHSEPDPGRKTDLVIVGRSKLSSSERDYLDWLKTKVSIPLSYRVIAI